MLKNKIKIIAILTTIILALTLPVVRAENETTNNTVNSDTATTENTSEENVSNEATQPTDLANNNAEMDASSTDDENFKRSDVYLTGDDITIDYIIDGNLFVVANHVTINSQIGGDAFICADTVTIGENGYVFSNLFTFAKNVNIDGVVYDLYAASETTNINNYVYRDIRIGSNTVNISGTIGRNAYIDCANLNFAQNTDTNESEEENANVSSQGVINGNLKYSAKQEASIPEGAVTGETTFEKETSFDGNTIQKQIMSLGTLLVTVVVIWLLCLWRTPKFLENTTSLLTTKKILPVIGFGILTPIASIIVAILLFILGATSKLALLLIITLVILMMISTSVFIIAITKVVCNKLKIEKTSRTFSILVMATIALWILNLIPLVNSLVGFVATVLGLGIVVSSIALKEKEDTEID